MGFDVLTSGCKVGVTPDPVRYGLVAAVLAAARIVQVLHEGLHVLRRQHHASDT